MKHNNFFKALIICMVLIFALILAAGVRGELDVKDQCRRDYRVINVDGGEPGGDEKRYFDATEFSVWLCSTTWEGKKVLAFKREERTPEGDSVLWEFILDPDNYSLIKAEKKITSRSGKVVARYEHDYRDEVYDFPPNTFHVNVLALAPMVINMGVGQSTDCYLLFSPEMKPWKVTLTVEAVEKIKVPAGEFECLKIRMEYDLEQFAGKWIGGSRLMKAFMPAYYIWVEKEYPHGMVKLQGKFGPPMGTPEQAHELVKIHADWPGKQ